jgi:hypothetical protein
VPCTNQRNKRSVLQSMFSKWQYNHELILATCFLRDRSTCNNYIDSYWNIYIFCWVRSNNYIDSYYFCWVLRRTYIVYVIWWLSSFTGRERPQVPFRVHYIRNERAPEYSHRRSVSKLDRFPHMKESLPGFEPIAVSGASGLKSTTLTIWSRTPLEHQ